MPRRASSDEQRLGMLGLDGMRAGRLVVDTGLHAFGWTRQQAVDYLRENTAMPSDRKAVGRSGSVPKGCGSGTDL